VKGIKIFVILIKRIKERKKVRIKKMIALKGPAAL